MDESTWLEKIISLITWLIEKVMEDENYEWVFSGIGISIIGVVATAISTLFIISFFRKRDTSKQEQPQGDNTTTTTQTSSIQGVTVQNIKNGSVIIKAGDTTHIHNDVSNEKLAAMEAKLNEISSKLNTPTETLITELGITKSALVSFFKILEKKHVPLEDLDSTLREIAKRYNALLKTVEHLQPEDPRVAELIEQAQQALKQCDVDKCQFAKAEMLFNEAGDLDIEAAKQLQAQAQKAQETANKRFLSAAKSRAANGELKMTQLAYKEAGEYFQEAAELLPAGNDEKLAEYLNSAGYAFDYAGLYDKTKPLFERSLSVIEKVLGSEHPNVATCLNNLALLHQTQGNYAQAQPLYERALAIWEKVYGEVHPQVAIGLNNLAELHRDLGNYEQAKPLYERALAIDEKVYGTEHPDVAIDLNNLAGLHYAQGNYEQAKPLYERALAIDEKMLGKEHPNVAIRLNNLANLHKALGNYEQAKPLLERSLAILEKVHGTEHPLVASSLNNLALLHKTQGNYEQAKPLYERALAIFEKVYGEVHPSVATGLNNLALLHDNLGNYEQAKPLFERSLAIREKVFGQEHPAVATGLNNLAGLHYAQGNYEQAKPLLERALAIFQKVLGDDHPNTRHVLKNYNDLLSKMNEAKNAPASSD